MGETSINFSRTYKIIKISELYSNGKVRLKNKFFSCVSGIRKTFFKGTFSEDYTWNLNSS